MGYILDIIFVCVLIISILIGFRRGFVKSAVKFLGAVIAICISSVLGGIFASWLYTAFFRTPFIDRVTETLEQASSGLGLESVLMSLPDFLAKALEEAGVTQQTLQGMMSGQQRQAAVTIVDAMSPALIGLLKILAVIVLFMLLMILVRSLANFADAVFELPILNVVNGLLGGVFGMLSAMIIIWLVIAVILIFLPMAGQGVQEIIYNYVQSSYFAKLFFNFNPVSAIIV